MTMMTTIPDNYENSRAQIVALLIPPEVQPLGTRTP